MRVRTPSISCKCTRDPCCKQKPGRRRNPSAFSFVAPKHAPACLHTPMSIPFDLISEFWEETVDWPETAQGGLSSEDFGAKYDRIIVRLKELALNLGTYIWEIGNLLFETDANYNMQNLGIPSYLIIGCHPP